jgi:lectin-like protein
MVSDAPTRRERASWLASIAIALSAAATSCSGLLDIPDKPYLAEPAPGDTPPIEDPPSAAPTPNATTPDTSNPPPELDIDDIQGGGSGTQVSGGNSRDAGVSSDGGSIAPDDSGVPVEPEPPAPDAGSTCLAGTTLGPSGRCYTLITIPSSGPVALLRCRGFADGWDMAAIHDSATNDFLNTLTNVDTWIGATDTTVEGEWFWVVDDIAFWSGDGDTGVPVNNQFEAWAGGEPNGEGDSSCARLVPNPPRWADLECDTLLPVLCEGPPL